jgi:signal transduction histidine kinase
MAHLLNKEHTILERDFMQYQPFGISLKGQKIRDVSGATVRANVEYLEEVVSRTQGSDAALRIVQELCVRLNQRIADPAYHVTPDFLKNVWNSYSYEFVMFLGEFCAVLAHDPWFHLHVGKERFISPLIQTLGRPFTVAQIYRMFPHFGQKFAKGSIEFGVGTVTDCSAILRMKYTDHVYEQFGPYRRRCAEIVCRSSKAALAAVPAQIHGLKPAEIRDLRCIADGDEYCEWEFSWESPVHGKRFGLALATILVMTLLGLLLLMEAGLSRVQALTFTLCALTGLWFTVRWRRLRRAVLAREQLIEEQLRFLEARHEELREAYLDQEEASVALRRKVRELTEAYGHIEALNLGLEGKVSERTAALETANRELARANEQLQELNSLKSAFVSIVSHEIRTPLTSMKGFVENLLDGLAGPLTEKQSSYLSRVKHNVERLSRMLNDLLDLSRIEAGRLEVQLGPMSLTDSVTEVVDGFQPIAKSKGIRLCAEPAVIPTAVVGDRDKLHQVLTNLVHNAIKFTPKGGEIRVDMQSHGDDLIKVCVSDTGPGIPPADVDRVFEKFFRGETAPPELRGAGLGLSITKTFVELHGGRIWVESTPRGSRFSFTLPTAKPCQPSEASGDIIGS